MRRFLRMPAVHGLIERRILVNFRVAPEVAQAILPPMFRPKLVAGWAIGGVCLIRLSEIRPRGVPKIIGVRSENAAHRLAVEWDTAGGTEEGVFVLRRDTNSRINAWSGGRVFPGAHHLARFDVRECGDAFRVHVQSLDGAVRILVEGEVAARLEENSVFPGIAEASRFFECGARGFSMSPGGRLELLELRSFSWQAEPLSLSAIESSCFDDRRLFPPGAVEYDSALLMRNIEHEWLAPGVAGTAALRAATVS